MDSPAGPPPISALPQTAESWAQAGAAHLEGGRPEQATECYRQVLRLDPDHAEAHFKLGNIAVRRQLPADAEASYRRAVSADSRYFKALYNLGNLLRLQSRLAEAEACYLRVIDIEPGYVAAHVNLGVTLKDLGRPADAEVCYRSALALEPDDAETLNNLGVVLKDQGRHDEAEAICRQSLALAPRNAPAFNNLGIILKEQGRLAEAEASYRRALQLAPDYPEAHNNLGVSLRELGRLDEAIAHYRHALNMNPDYFNARSNLLLGLCFGSDPAPARYLEQAKQFGVQAAAKAADRFDSWICNATPDRLRVGLVSGDLRDHPVGHFLEGLLAHVDPQRIELIAYPTVISESELTHRIKPYFAAWKPITGLKDKDAATLIRNDGVHVLIDLSGHTAHNRLPMFAFRPAPVQATWLGYLASTGVTAMDYLIADEWTLPKEGEAYFSEKIWRLPGSYICFTPPTANIPVSALPATGNGYVTFGSFNNLAKMNDRVVALWAKILNAVPNSRLFLKSKPLQEEAVRRSVAKRFGAHGVDPRRLLLKGLVSRAEYLAPHQEVDIALDPFPYPGITTSVESLWMGVPVLTMSGKNFLARQGVGLMMNARIPEWIADDADDYLARAIRHARDLDNLSTLRKGLREQLLGSPVLNAVRFAANFESSLRDMWSIWRTANARQLEAPPQV